MKKVTVVTAAVLAASIATPAAAQDAEQTGVYVQLNAGLGSLDDLPITAVDADGAGTDVGLELGTKSAFEFGGAIGYDFGLIRAELEVAYARARSESVTLKSVDGTAVPANTLEDLLGDSTLETDLIDLTEADNVQINGNTLTFDNGDKLRRLSAMANLWVDIPLGMAISPYVGGGLGIQGTEIAGEGKGTFAWQLGAGVSFPITSSLSLAIDYRHREQKGYTLSEDGFDYARVGKAKSNSVTAGVRFYF